MYNLYVRITSNLSSPYFKINRSIFLKKMFNKNKLLYTKTVSSDNFEIFIQDVKYYKLYTKTLKLQQF